MLLPVSIDKLCGKAELNICGIDHGIRTFAAVFEPWSNTVIKYEKNDYWKQKKYINKKYQIKIDINQHMGKELLNRYGLKTKEDIGSKIENKDIW